MTEPWRIWWTKPGNLPLCGAPSCECWSPDVSFLQPLAGVDDLWCYECGARYTLAEVLASSERRHRATGQPFDAAQEPTRIREAIDRYRESYRGKWGEYPEVAAARGRAQRLAAADGQGKMSA